MYIGNKFLYFFMESLWNIFYFATVHYFTNFLRCFVIFSQETAKLHCILRREESCFNFIFERALFARAAKIQYS